MLTIIRRNIETAADHITNKDTNCSKVFSR